MNRSKRNIVAVMVAGLCAAIAMPPDAFAGNKRKLKRILGGVGAAVILNEIVNGKKRVVRKSYANPAKQAKQREERREIQRRLNALGFDAGAPDGIFGPRTRRAIMAFERSIGTGANGRLSTDEVNRLYAMSAPLMVGGAGYAASNLQPGDSSSGFSAVAPNDSFGNGSSGFPPVVLNGEDGFAHPDTTFPTIGSTEEDNSEENEEIPLAAVPKFSGEKTENSSVETFSAINGAEGEGMNETNGETAATDEAAATTDANSGYAGPVTSLEMALATGNPYTPEDQPAILDIRLGTPLSNVDAFVSETSSLSCEIKEDTALCQRSTDTFEDELRIFAHGDRVYAMMRDIEFADAISVETLEEKFLPTYPELIGAPGQFEAAGNNCTPAENDEANVRAIHDILKSEPGTEIPDALLQRSRDCLVTYHLDFGPDDATDTVRVTMIDYTGVIAAEQNNLELAKSEKKQEEKKVVTDLEL